MAGIKERLSRYFEKLTPKKKRNLVAAFLVTAFVVLAFVAYELRGRTEAPVAQSAPDEKRDISLEPNMIARTQLAETQKTNDELDKRIKDLTNEVEGLKTGRGADSGKEGSMPPPPPGAAADERGTGATNAQAGGSYPRGGASGPMRYPPSPPPLPGNYQQSRDQGPRAVSESEIIGGIEIASNTQDPLPAPDDKKPEDKKKEPRKVYLPTGSFMAGTLLSGLDAPVMEGAKKDPIPVLLRVNDLAVLPNEVKGNLRGCFVIAHGYGDLASERAELKLVTLSCLSKKGEAVIDQPVSGFVVDADGKIGLAGKVVAKLGSLIARSAVAGFFAGIGDFLKASTTTTQVTSAGSIQTIDTSRLATAGLGGGLSTAAGELSKFYMELARMSMPVIEIGATRKITIVVSQGIDLEIKEKKRVEEK
jgi:conjugal transfer pilus assembly protein TraB